MQARKFVVAEIEAEGGFEMLTSVGRAFAWRAVAEVGRMGLSVAALRVAFLKIADLCLVSECNSNLPTLGRWYRQCHQTGQGRIHHPRSTRPRCRCHPG